MEQIELRILDGRLKAGDRLPSEREFSAMLGISRPSLRESLRVLEALGIVRVRLGGGVDAGTVLVGEPGPGIGHLLKLQLALGHFDHNDILDTRIALETWCCGEAAHCATDPDHNELSAILDEMEATGITADDFNRLDAAFHVRIADATGNALAAHLMGSLRTAINRQMIDAYARLEDWEEQAKVVRHEHRQILAAIREKQPEIAQRRVSQHIRDFYRIGNLT